MKTVIVKQSYFGLFREWTGEVRFIPNLKLRRVFAKDRVDSTECQEQAQLNATADPTTNDGRDNT